MARRRSCGPRRTTTSSWCGRSSKPVRTSRRRISSARPRSPKPPSSARRRSSTRCSRPAPIPTRRTPEGETPLMAAARSGHVDAAKRLLDAGADVNAKESFGGQSALMWAAAQRQAAMVKFLASRWRRPQRARRRPPVGAQGHHGAASEGHEQGRVHAAAVCRPRRLRRVREASGRSRRRSRSRRSRPRHAAQHGAAQPALRVRGVHHQGRRRRRQMGLLRPVTALHGRRRQHAADKRQRRRWP